ncbi:GNAT family N-acetyltransferase [Dyadobacter aurulentus]|uniref:GNAT family N-acetyltransferase n=1 Tax=Dyadobacter sp. UC 10 TaxID=2605428 RepID=UPI0011F32148|nr:GNAT family N-acetyltransferase [Dyadobacter sp. UC 10]KAA0993517.1 GNAT family N-acetyltransferase [Dyadobacter sp. UC 10]
MEFSINVLDNGHKKENFKCERESLDDYIKKQAKQDVKRALAVCYVLEDSEKIVKGYFTLSAASIPREDLPEVILAKLPKGYVDFPATLLGRLALDITVKGQGLGSSLLYVALKKALTHSEVVASMAVIVDPLDDAAKSFYNKHDFIDLPGSGRMFLPMATIKKLIEQEDTIRA